MFGLGPTEMIVIGILGILLFGNRLPGVAKSLGRSITEFKKGVNNIEDAPEKKVANEEGAK
jgi:sec-independent protein translocase protein TatA